MPATLPALMVGGVRSGCGKTTLTLALLAALQARNIRVLGCKAGPDFIDPAHHSALTGQPSFNLDAWMGGEHGLERAFAAAQQHLQALPPLSLLAPLAPLAKTPPQIQKILVVEGVMGLFDGASSPELAGEGAGSSAQVARRCALPVLLVVDVRGMAQSVAPLVQGFLRYRNDIRFAGIVCTHVGGQRHQIMLRQALSHVDAPLVGFLPRAGAPSLPSRHLGLCMPHEVTTHAASLATWLEDNADLDALLSTLCKLCTASPTQERTLACASAHGNTPPSAGDAVIPMDIPASTPPLASTMLPHSRTAPLTNITSPTALTSRTGSTSQQDFRTGTKSLRPTGPVIAIAHDHAFCFLYPDFAPLFQSLGARIVFFSPLRDLALPRCDALYLPGGYPELFAPQLSANVAMRTSIFDHAQRGGTIYGECGGYMYMMRSITTLGTNADKGTNASADRGKGAGTWPMCGCLPLECRMEEQRVALGYRNAVPASPASRTFWGSETPVRGHEYHYARLVPSQQPAPPLWQVSDAAGTPLADEGTCMGRLAGSWLHLYPQGARDLLQHFVQGLQP